MRFSNCFRFVVVLLAVPAWTVGFWYIVFTRPEILIGLHNHPQRASRFEMAYLVTFGAIWTAIWLRPAIHLVRLLGRSRRMSPGPADGGRRRP